MTTHVINAEMADSTTMDAFDRFIADLPEGGAREAIQSLAGNLRAGNDIFIAGANDDVTPAQAAKLLGVSRPHLYKVMDSGALPYSIVGQRDRRISLAHLHSYMVRADELRQEVARQAACQRANRARALDEM